MSLTLINIIKSIELISINLISLTAHLTFGMTENPFKVELEEHDEGCDVCEVSIGEGEHELEIKEGIKVIAASGVLLFLGLIAEFFLGLPMLAYVLFILTAVVSGHEIFRKGFSSLLFRRRLTIDVLISIAAIGSFFIGHGEEGAAVLFLFYIAEFLEEYAVERARRSIRMLMELTPKTALVRRGNREVEVPVHEVGVGEIVIVRPGEKIPIDGLVVKGMASVDQAPVTGESIPVPKEVGDEVYAGTINVDGFLEVKVIRPASESMISKIARLVEEAQRRKSRVERFVDRFSRYYTPLVVFLALNVAIIPPFIFGLPMNEWVYRALVLLVVSCPCALAISTPVAMVSAITGAARNGVLIKGGTYVEEVGKVRIFAFDKTGTLTEGNPEVTDVMAFDGGEAEVLRIAASIEARSEHPIAKAIVRYAESRGVERGEVTDFKAIPGRGVIGVLDGREYRIGSKKLFDGKLNAQLERSIREFESQGKTVVLLGNSEKVIGLIALRDRVRDGAQTVINKLKKLGISTVMLTGDNEKTGRAIADLLGIDICWAGLLPEDKVRIIEELSKRYGGVAMVGDGINDAPALARADVGIAMGVIGSDIALETADIALMRDDLSRVPYLVELSKTALRVVRENIAASIIVKGAFAVLALVGMITLWLAVGIGDMGLSLAVILNAMRLSLIKPSRI